MSLRRTGIARKSELKRGGELRRTPLKRSKVLAAKRVQVISRKRRDTGPTPAQRALVAERARYSCEICSTSLHDGTGWTKTHSFHHRQARGMGSSRLPNTNSPANLLLTCGSGTTGCHGFIEAHRTSAGAEGWIVRHGQDPADVPVTVCTRSETRRLCSPSDGDGFTRRVLLTPDGEYEEIAA